MADYYPTTQATSRKWQWPLAALLLLGSAGLQAQDLNYRPSNAQNVAGSYTDLGTTGTAITTTDTDDSNSTAQDIGFTFNYNGQSFTQFVLNTNGYLRLGAEAPAAALYLTAAQGSDGGAFRSTAATDVNLLIPFGVDLIGNAGAEYRLTVTGTAPNRICTIQWKDVRDKARPATTTAGAAVIGEQYASFSFQTKLYETTNAIEFVYNAPTAGTGANAYKAGQVGLKGASAADAQVLTVGKGSAQAWSAAIFQQNNYEAGSTAAFNFRKNVPPDAGRTYRFLPVQANDASVVTIYTLGKLPLGAATPHVMQGVVRNVGSNTLTNVPVTVAVTGANSFTNTQTIASLPSGATAVVSFAPFTPTVVGTDNITVSLGADDLASNNTATIAQLVTNGVYSYATPDADAYTSYGGSTTALAFLSRFTANDSRYVQAVNVYIGDVSAVGKVVYGVAVNRTGTIVGRSLDYTVTAADVRTYKTFTLSAPVLFSADDFFVGLALSTSATSYFPVGTQAEDPTRRMASYLLTIGDGSAPADLSTSTIGKFMIEAVTAPATCLPPTNLAVVINSLASTTASLSFTAPAGTAPSGYSIVYGPTGFDPATAGTIVPGTASPVVLTGLTAATTYQAYVRSTCSSTDLSIFSSPVAFTTLCTPPAPVATFPYVQNFDGVTAPALPCGFTTLDANTDGYTWATSTSAARSGSNSLTYNFNNQSLTTAADDWVFTPALTLTAAEQYNLSFYYQVGTVNGAAVAERLEVKLGTAPTVADMTTTIYANNLTATTFTQASTTQPVKVAANGQYYIGMHVISPANSFRLSIDDMQLTTGVLATNAALSRSIDAYPNPTTGLLTLDLRSTAARQVQATLVNTLGQTVLSRSFSNKQQQLDLSNLATGIYTLKLNIDGEIAVKRISVRK